MKDDPGDLDRMLTRQQLAAVLTAAGYPISPATLATRATRGGGPPFVKFNARALYRLGDALAWARANTSVPRASTSEAA